MLALVVAACTLPGLAEATTRVSDIEAVCAFYTAMGGPSWTNKQGWDSCETSTS